MRSVFLRILNKCQLSFDEIMKKDVNESKVLIFPNRNKSINLHTDRPSFISYPILKPKTPKVLSSNC